MGVGYSAVRKQTHNIAREDFGTSFPMRHQNI